MDNNTNKINLNFKEKQLYNLYLRVSRESRDKLFSYRKDFDNLEDDKKLNIKRISNMLSKYPHINPELYFKAPFVLHPAEDYVDLKFYAGMGGIEAFAMYMKYLQELPPDTPEQLTMIKQSLKVIGEFCYKHKLSVKEYIHTRTGITYEWMKQLKRHEINFYVLVEFPEIYDIIIKIAEDEKELFLGDLMNDWVKYKTKYINSKNAKILVKEGIKKIESIIKENK